jgi:AraC family transcriptional regulator
MDDLPTLNVRIAVRTPQRTGNDPAERLLLDHYRLDLCITPRAPDARAGYPSRWDAHRFERIGDIMLVPPGEPLDVRGEGDGSLSSIRCELRGALAERWLGPASTWTDHQLAAALDVSSLTVRHLIRGLAEEASNPGPGSAELTHFIAGQLVIELGRYLHAVGDDPVKGGLSAWRLRLIDERLRDPDRLPTLVELSELCRMSVRHLTRAFRTSRGCTLGDYMQHSRMEHAKRLLRNDQSIKSIAQQLGFSSPSSFAIVFRKATGVRPLDFRQRIVRSSAPSMPEGELGLG